MKVDRGEVERASDQEDHTLDGVEVGEATSAALSSLEQAAKRSNSEEAAGLASLGPGDGARGWQPPASARPRSA